MRILPRRIEGPVLDALGRHPAVMLDGLRGCGKTTILRRRLRESRHYVSLADPAVRHQARHLPREFLSSLPRPVNLDQVELAPGLPSAVASILEEEPQAWQPGSILMARTMGASLDSDKGHLPALQLWSLAASEILPPTPEDGHSIREYLRIVLRGGLPALQGTSQVHSPEALQSYLDDLRVRDLEPHLQKRCRAKSEQFLGILAQHSSGCPNQAEWAREMHLAPNTSKAWWDHVLNLGLCYETPAFPDELGPRALRSPRYYLADTGLLASLLGSASPEAAFTGPHADRFLSSFVSGELMRLAAHEGEVPLLYHWRTADGAVVDFVFESEGRLHAVVCTVAERPNRKQNKALERFLSLVAPARRGHALAICLRESPGTDGRVQLIPVMRVRDF